MNHPSAVAPAGDLMPVTCETSRGGTYLNAASTQAGGSRRVNGYLRAKSSMRSG